MEFEAHLIRFLETSLIFVMVRSYNSFGDIRGTEIYIPTLLELSQLPNMSHAMLCTGSYDFSFVFQDSGGLEHGEDDYVFISRGLGPIINFIVMDLGFHH